MMDRIRGGRLRRIAAGPRFLKCNAARYDSVAGLDITHGERRMTAREHSQVNQPARADGPAAEPARRSTATTAVHVALPWVIKLRFVLLAGEIVLVAVFDSLRHSSISPGWAARSHRPAIAVECLAAASVAALARQSAPFARPHFRSRYAGADRDFRGDRRSGESLYASLSGPDHPVGGHPPQNLDLDAGRLVDAGLRLVVLGQGAAAGPRGAPSRPTPWPATSWECGSPLRSPPA